jgi:uncharacterized protein YkwD
MRSQHRRSHGNKARSIVGRRAEPSHEGRTRWNGVGPRLVATAAIVFALAPGAVLLRSALAPGAGPAQPGSVASPQGSPPAGACPAGQACADEGGDTTATPVAEAGYLRLYELVNAERQRAGRLPLRLEDRLMASARSHAADMAARAFAGLTDPDGDGPQERARKVGYQGNVTEIVAAGLPTAEAVFRQWTNPRNPASKAVMAKMTDRSRVNAGIAYYPGQVKSTYNYGIWVLDMGDA